MRAEKGVWESFFEDYKNKSTRKTYRWGLTHFFKSVYGADADPRECAEKYFEEGRTEEDFEDDVHKFATSELDSPPASYGKFLSTVRLFLEDNRVDLRRPFWRKEKRRNVGSEGITVDRPPTVAELREILTHMDAKGKALFLLLASSGMRIGEALALKLRDVDLDKDPVAILIRSRKEKKTKTGKSRWAFISTEAKEAIKEWLKIRKDYAKTAVQKTWHRHAEGRKYLKSLKGREPDPEEVKALIERIAEKVDDRLFPFKATTAFAMWTNALKKSGLDERDEATKFYTLHIHTLRKFARTQFGTVHKPHISQSLVGHKKGMDKTYEMFSPQQLGKFYKQSEHTVTIFGNPVIDVEKVKEEVTLESKGQIDLLKEELRELRKILFEKTGEIYMMPDFDKKMDELRELIDHEHNEMRKLRDDMELIKEWIVGMSKIS